MTANKIRALLLGAGGRGNAYASYAKSHPNDIQFTAVAEPNKERLNAFTKEHNIPGKYCFDDWRKALNQKQFADVAFICTQDKDHFEPAVMAVNAGYHVILEKPMAVSPKECIELGKLAKKHNRVFAICHVLRYTAFFGKIKELLDSGAIGRIMNIEHKENVWNVHHAHSFVRGNWRNSMESSPMILAKSCHDMDIILWLANTECTSVSSYGKLSHFKKECAPKGAPERCLDGCPVSKTCPYNCERVYITEPISWMVNAVSEDRSYTGLTNALRTGPYGRCVYHCDNDVVDHQVVGMEFKNDITAVFTMSAFNKGGREIVIMGTDGMLTGKDETGQIEVYKFGTKHTDTYDVTAQGGGHGGGDHGLMAELISSLKTGGNMNTRADISVESHLMAFAAEFSRVNKQMIDMSVFRKMF